MSNPRNSQEELDRAFAALAEAHGMSVQAFTAAWNAGARRADAEWALQPHERSNWSGDQDTTGAPLHGPGSREARHHQHMVKAKEEE